MYYDDRIMMIGDRAFERVKLNTKRADSIINTVGKSWSDLYVRPSDTKESIRNDWLKFFADIGIYDVTYMGNSMTFSIYAKDKCEGAYFLITKSHNYVIVEG